MRTEPKPFVPREMQKPMIEHMLEHDRCGIWAKPGSGKTSAVLTALDCLVMAGEDDPILVLAPLRVARSTWSDEVRKWSNMRHLGVRPIVGTAQERLQALQSKSLIYTCNYENLLWLTEFWGDRWPYRTVIADESTKLKSVRVSFQQRRKKDGTLGREFVAGQGGKRARALAKVAHYQTKRFIELTGTPSPNGLQDLWGQMWFLDGGKRLGRTFEAFKERWFQTKPSGWGIEACDWAEEQIHTACADICVSVDPRDYYDIREPVVTKVPVRLPAKALADYRKFEKEMFLALEDARTVEAFAAGGKVQKCQQMANGAVYLDPLVEGEQDPRSKEWREVHTAKLEALESIIEESGGENVMVVYKFHSDRERLLRHFKTARVLKTKQDEDDFKAGLIPILLVQPQGASHGIDGFQYACRTVIFFSQDWNAEEHDQVLERVGPTRQMQAGLDRAVLLYYIIAEDTIDEDIVDRRELKLTTQEALMRAAKRRGYKR